MAYFDDKPTGIIDTRITPEGPQFPPRPRGFTFAKEIEKEIRKRLPAMPYVPTQADEAFDESPEAKDMAFRMAKEREFVPPKAILKPPEPPNPSSLGDRAKRSIAAVRSELRYYDAQESWSILSHIDSPPRDVEERIDYVLGDLRYRSKPGVSEPFGGRRDPATVARMKQNLLSWYRSIFERPDVREEVEAYLRERNPSMRTGPSPWDRITGNYPWYIMMLTNTFLHGGPPTMDNLLIYDALYHNVFVGPLGY